jgi:RNA polymerase sigma-70 factor (ECF subfamily)
MAETKSLADRFEEQRRHLESLAYRLLGSLGQADDAVHEAWQRLVRVDQADVEDLSAWLTGVVARVCLDSLRKQRSRRRSLPMQLPDPLVERDPGSDAEVHAHGGRLRTPSRTPARTDTISLALFVVLETLAPAERLTFVLQELCALRNEQIAPILGRTPTAVRQLASRARRRVSGASSTLGQPELSHGQQRCAVDTFLAATRRRDFDGLLALLDPDVVLRADRGDVPSTRGCELRGAGQVAKRALQFARLAETARPALVNGTAGAVSWLPGGQPFSVIGFTLTDRRIVELYVFADPARLALLNLSSCAL